MRVDIVQGKKKRTLRRIAHKGEVYVMAPKKGSYTISLYNHTNRKRLAVVTVDGVNVITGKDGDFDGPGYVVDPFETMEIPGWRRDDGTVAAFLFRPEKKSYANQTGRGTSNVGVVGVAVFDQKPQRNCRCPEGHHEHHHHHYTWPVFTTTTFTSGGSGRYGSGTPMPLTTITCSTAGGGEEQTLSGLVAPDTAQPRSAPVKKGITRRRRRVSTDSVMMYDSAPEDVGTGYGHEVEFQTTTTIFERATEAPALVQVLRYATRERLQTWGVPVDQMEKPIKHPKAFPVSQGPSVPAPPGWRG